MTEKILMTGKHGDKLIELTQDNGEWYGYAIVDEDDNQRTIEFGEDRAICFDKATQDLFWYSNGTPTKEMVKHQLELSQKKYERLLDVAQSLVEGLIADDKDSALEYFRETCGLEPGDPLTEKLGIQYPDVYKLVEVTYTRTQTFTGKLLVKVDDDDADDLADSYYDYIEDSDFETEKFDFEIAELEDNITNPGFDYSDVMNWDEI